MMLDSVVVDGGEGDSMDVDGYVAETNRSPPAMAKATHSASLKSIPAAGDITGALSGCESVGPTDDAAISMEDLRSSTISLPRLLRALVAPGQAIDYSTIRPVLLSLGSFGSPAEFVDALCDIYYRPSLSKEQASGASQIRFKVMAILLCWLEQRFAHSDLLSTSLQKKIRAVARDALNTKDEFLHTIASRVRTQIRRLVAEVRHLELATKLYFLRSVGTQGLHVGGGAAATRAHSPRPPVISLASPASPTNFSSPIRPISPATPSFIGDFDSFNAGRDGSDVSISEPSSGVVEDSFAAKEPVVVDEEIDDATVAFSTSTNADVDDAALARSSYRSYAAQFKTKSDSIALSPARAYTMVAAASMSPPITLSIRSRSSLSSPTPANNSRSPSKSLNSERGVSLIRDLDITASVPLTLMKQSIMEVYTHYELAGLLTGSELLLGWSIVRQRELMNLTWTKEELKEIHPDLGGAAHIHRLINATNKRIIWVASEIIYYSVFLGPVSDALEYFILVANTAMRQRNFNLVFAIISAIGLPCIIQLKLGWQNLSRSKSAIYSKLKQFCDSQSNNLVYRHILSRETGPFIPCLQLLIKDLTIYENSHKSLVCGGKLIDMEKVVYMFDFLERMLPKVTVNWGSDCLHDYCEALSSTHLPTPSSYNVRIEKRKRSSMSGRVSFPSSPSRKPEFAVVEDKYTSPGKSGGYDVNDGGGPSILVFPSFRDGYDACVNSMFEPLRRSAALLSEGEVVAKRSYVWDRDQRVLLLESAGMTSAPDASEQSPQVSSLSRISDIQAILVATSPAGSPRVTDIVEGKGDPFSFVLQGKDILRLEAKIDSSCHDLTTLWNDSKVANFAETRRLMLKLCKAGLV